MHIDLNTATPEEIEAFKQREENARKIFGATRAREIMEQVEQLDLEIDALWQKKREIENDITSKIREAVKDLENRMREQLEDAAKPDLHDLQVQREAFHERRKELLGIYRQIAADPREGQLWVNYETSNSGWYSNRIRFTYWKVELIREGADLADLAYPRDRWTKMPDIGDLIFRRCNEKGKLLKSWEIFPKDEADLSGPYSGWRRVDAFPAQREVKSSGGGQANIARLLGEGE